MARTQDGVEVSPQLVHTYDVMMDIFNDAIRDLPAVECGPGSKYGISCPTWYGPCGWPFDCTDDGKYKDEK